MNDTIVGVLGVIVALGILVIVTSALDRRSKEKGNLFTDEPSPTMRIAAIALALPFGGIFVAELLWRSSIHIWPPILAVALLAYAVGAEGFIMRIQGGQKDRDSQDDLR